MFYLLKYKFKSLKIYYYYYVHKKSLQVIFLFQGRCEFLFFFLRYYMIYDDICDINSQD